MVAKWTKVPARCDQWLGHILGLKPTGIRVCCGFTTFYVFILNEITTLGHLSFFPIFVVCVCAHVCVRVLQGMEGHVI